MPEKEPRTTWQAGPIKDARGRSVRQLDPVIMHLSRRHGAIPPEPLRQIAQDVGIGMTRANQIAFWGGVLCLVCLCIAIVILFVRLQNGTIGLRKSVLSLLPYGGAWIAPYAFWKGTRGVRFQRITKVMLEHRRCPHCGYDIRGLPADSTDGATVCPECGCPWMLDEPQQAGEMSDG
jgi:hypothetical protein